MYGTHCIAMVLAGGRGERLGELTRFYSKPAVHFGCCSKIIDFTLRNCRHSGIDVIGVLTQYLAADLNAYINVSYNSQKRHSYAYALPPQSNDQRYTATADAVFKNIQFIDRFQPKHVLILSGDHIYHMDYSSLIAFHDNADADVTVASTAVPISDAPRFGILSADTAGRICGFEEKPIQPKSNLASMGIYVFKWDVLKRLLIADSKNGFSGHDFGKDIIPGMLSSNHAMFAYPFSGYWRDVGTLDSLWTANMDLIASFRNLKSQHDRFTSIGAKRIDFPFQPQSDQSIIWKDCTISGAVSRSVLADQVTVCKGAEVIDSVLMPGAYIGENARIYKTIVGTGAKVMRNAEIGTDAGADFFVDTAYCREDISLVAPWAIVPGGIKIQKNSQIYSERLRKWHESLSSAVMLGQFETAAV